jgi:hypothetical protein
MLWKENCKSIYDKILNKKRRPTGKKLGTLYEWK